MDQDLTVQVALRVNGVSHDLAVSTSAVLADVLRDDLGLFGVKVGCGRGVCGSCTCLVDGQPVASCNTFAWDVEGAEVETVEGLAIEGVLSPVQRAFLECSAFQCGYCTSGMIVLATALLREHPDPTPDQVRAWITSNICRCTGYESILVAVGRAVELADSEARAR